MEMHGWANTDTDQNSLIPFLQPSITHEDVNAAARAMTSGWLVLGDRTKEFECAFAEYLGASHCVLVNSCTSALHLSLITTGVSAGSEVIVPAITYVATANPIHQIGATPVFVDVEPKSGLLDIRAVEAAITPKTSAIIAVDLYGRMADMEALRSLAEKHGLTLIEDAAHAIEASYKGYRPGCLSATACFSFHVAKNITAGTGGALVTNDTVIADRARLLRRDGVRNIGNSRHMEEVGFKYLVSEYQAAILTSQLVRVDEQWTLRRNLFERYAKAFRDDGIAFNEASADSKHAYHMFVIRVHPAIRDRLRSVLASEGIETSVHYNPVPFEPFYCQRMKPAIGDFPNAELFGFGCITLPLYPSLALSTQDRVIESVIQNHRILVSQETC